MKNPENIFYVRIDYTIILQDYKAVSLYNIVYYYFLYLHIQYTHKCIY